MADTVGGDAATMTPAAHRRRLPTSTPTRWRRALALALLGLLLLTIASTWFLRRYFGSTTPMQLLLHLQHGGLGHADPALLMRGLRYLVVTLLVMAGLAALLWRLPARARRLLWAMLVLGAVWSVAAALRDPCDPQGGDLLAQHYQDPKHQRFDVVGPRPDILLVFVESLDEAFAHPRPGREALLPQLVAWRQPQRRLGALQAVDGAHWTMGGLFAALCGLHLQPVGLTSRGDYSHAGPFFAGGLCLTDLLATQGWEISFHGGASLDFAGKGRFLADHGVTRRFGREQWLARGLAVPEGWGLLDHALMQQVWQDIDRPGSADPRRPPRLHLVLTVDTHVPRGAVDDGCAWRPADDDDRRVLRAAMRCSDEAVAGLVRRFVARADGRPKLVWLMGDHLMPRAVLAADVDPAAAPRRLFQAWARFDAQGREQPLSPDLATRAYSAVDVMPTLAEAAGLRWQPAAHRLGLGVSLLSPQGGPTLVEREGADRMGRRLACPSPVFQRLWTEPLFQRRWAEPQLQPL